MLRSFVDLQCVINSVKTTKPPERHAAVRRQRARIDSRARTRHHVPPGRQRRLRPHLLPLRRQRRLHRRPLRPLRERPGLGRRRVARLLRRPEGRRAPTSPRARRAPPGQKPNWPLRPNGDLVAALDGQLGRDREDDRRQDQGARRRPTGVELAARRRACRRRAIRSTR